MNPRRLVLRNYRRFDGLDLDLPAGCAAIMGESSAGRSNGAGKSSIVEAIEVALFGSCRTGDLVDQRTAGAAPDEDLLVELQFDHAGALYRVRRTYSARGRGKPTLDLETLTDTGDGWVPLTKESIRDTQARIEALLSLSHATFRASAFIAQKDGGAFTEAKPAERKKVLTEILELARWDRLLTTARVERRGLEDALLHLDGRERVAAELVATKPDVERDRADAIAVEVDAADDVADRERAHQALAKRWADAREQVEQRRTAEAELANARATRDQLDVLNAAAEEAVIAQQVTRDERDTLPTGDVSRLYECAEIASARLAQLLADRQERLRAAEEISRREQTLEQRRGEWEAIAEKIATLNASIAALDSEEHPACDRCGQELDGDVRARARQSFIDESTAHAGRANDLMVWILNEQAAVAELTQAAAVDDAGAIAAAEAEKENALGELRSVQDAATTRARLEERLVALKATIDQRPTTDALLAVDQAVVARERMLDTLGEPVDVAAIEREGLAVKAALDVAKAALDKARITRARLEERLAQIHVAEEQLAKTATEQARLIIDVDRYVALERALSPSGIPMLVVEAAAIPQIETDANRIAAELGFPVQIELRTQREKKDGGLADALDIVITDENGSRPYETYSGGEGTTINLALNIALAKLLTHRRGADIDLLVIDEPEGLDEYGMTALVRVLRDLESDFQKLYVVSHVPALRDSFDEVLTVVKGDDGRSTVAEQGVFEPVPA